MMNDHYVFLEDQLAGRRRLYQNPQEIITAHTPNEIASALARMEACREQGQYLAGYCSYELGYVFEEKLRPIMPKNMDAPLLQFGVFDEFTDAELPDVKNGQIDDLSPSWDFNDYRNQFDKVLAWIRSGDVYQVNLTFPFEGTYHGDAAAIYEKLKSAQPVKYGGVISLGGADIVSLSPELFFEIQSGKITMRPMKGTVRRGETKAHDKALAKALQADVKNRSENLMIVDLLRNDLSRISKTGSVAVTDLFSIETYPSLHTMTSEIEAELKTIPFAEIMRALFPCGSVTGAPKIRAMEIIRALEASPRGSYCGALGLIDPNGYMRFNVGIRTLNLYADGRLNYRVGSGVVADSIARYEYEECLLKAEFLKEKYNLIETFGWQEQTGFKWLDLHLARLEKSSDELGFKYSKKAILKALNETVMSLSGGHKIRLELSKDGSFDISTIALKMTNPNTAWGLTLSKNPVSSSNTLLAHKTTRRQFIDEELRRLQDETGCKEIIFFNERGELCEGSYSNVFIVKDGQMLTPPVSCGLLPGVLRQALIMSEEVREHILTISDLISADEIYIGNSVRGLIKARLLNPERQ